MKTRVVLRLSGTLLKLLGLMLVIPGAVAAYYGEVNGVIAFSLATLLTLVSGIVLERLGIEEKMGAREGFAVVAFGWLAASFFGALPYMFLGIGLVDALFESMAGFTTTGSSIFTEYNAQGYWIINSTAANQSLAFNLPGTIAMLAHNLSWNLTNATVNYTLNASNNSSLYIFLKSKAETTYYGLLFWRSFSQWLGGMGIILLFIAILPKLGVAGRQLYKAEVPGPEKDAVTPRIRQTAKILWGVYVLISALEAILLVAAGMPLFDALCNTFASMATGGFSPQAASIAAYRSQVIEGIITLFCFIAGANFVLHYRMLYEERTALFKDYEFRFYALIVLVATAIIMAWGGIEGDVFLRFRYAIFQVVTIMTTTCFSTTDFDRWTTAAKFTLLMLMFVGACAGSTGGAIKVSRILLVLKYGYRELFRALHPKAVVQVKLGRITIKEEILHTSLVFFAFYIIIFTSAAMMLAVVSFQDPRMDMETIISAVATTLGNVGPGFGLVGPTLSFAEITPAGKMVLFLCMWIGRLEIITVLVLLLREFWKE